MLSKELQDKPDNIKFYERRVRATKDMELNEHFLGGLNDIDQALNSNLRAH